MMRVHAAYVFLGVLVVAVAVAGWGAPQPFETAYDIQIELSPEAHLLQGSQHVTITNRSDHAFDSLAFVLIANWGAEENPYLHPAVLDEQYLKGFDPTYTHILSVTAPSGEALSYELQETPPFMQTYSLADGVLMVDLPAALAPGATTELSIAFETKFAAARSGDQSVVDDTYVWRFGWNPVLVDPSAVAGKFELPASKYSADFTLPEEYTLLAGADSQEIVGVVVGWKTVRLTNTHATRSIPLLFGPDLDVVQTEWNGIKIACATLPGGESYARIAESLAQEILSSYEGAYGPLANKRIVIAENPAPGLFGMAADGMVLVGSSIIRQYDMPALDAYARLNEYLLAHELAHLYWGIGIGADFNAENWISEGFAEYLSITYFEDKYGAFNPNLLTHLGDGIVEDVLVESFGYLNLRQHYSESQYLALLLLGFDEPIVQPMADSAYLNGLVARTYSKGYLVLRALSSFIGEDAMHQVLSTALERWYGAVLSAGELETLVEEMTTADVEAFFDQWVFGVSTYDPAISGFVTHASVEGYETTLKLSGVGDLFPLKIAATLEDGSEQVWQLTSEETATPLVTQLPVNSVHLDLDESLPDANRFNNHWPRRILVDHPFRSSDAPVIGAPLDAYVIKLSALGISGQFRNQQKWSIMALPHVDPDASSYDSWEDLPASVDIVATFAEVVDRELRFLAAAEIAGLDPRTCGGQIDVLAAAQRTFFTQPDVGASGTYWEPSLMATLAFGAKGTLALPIPFVQFSVTYSEQMTDVVEARAVVDLGLPGFEQPTFGSAKLSLAKRLRLGHLFYLDLHAKLSETLFADLPDEFLFSMDNLHAFQYLPMGHHQQFARIELILPPLVRNAGYAIFNLTRIDSITPSMFVQGGRTKANCTEVCEPGIRAEAGALLSIRFPLFLGAALELQIGLAQPLYGIDGTLTPFVAFASGWGAD